MSADGVFAGEPRPLFTSGIPRVEEAEPFELKPVENVIIQKIQARYNATHRRLETMFPGDEGEWAPAYFRSVVEYFLGYRRIREACMPYVRVW